MKKITSKKITAKKITYWLLGETAARTSIGVWNRLWGLPTESGGKIAEKVAQESIQSMQQSIAQLTNAVAKVVAAYELAKQQHNQKLKEFHQAEKQAQQAYSQGNQERARLAMTKAISIEKILPQLSDRVAQAEATMNKAKAKLRRETERLEAYKLEMANLETITLINQAMAEIGEITSEFDLESARSQFENIKDSIEQRAFIEEAKASLAENPSEAFEAEINSLSLDAEIERRLKNLEQ